MDAHELQAGATLVIELASRANRFVQETEPWKLAKEKRAAELDTVLASLVRTVARLAVLSAPLDRKSTLLNSSHGYISYAVFCFKKKNSTGQFATVILLPRQIDACRHLAERITPSLLSRAGRRMKQQPTECLLPRCTPYSTCDTG